MCITQFPIPAKQYLYIIVHYLHYKVFIFTWTCCFLEMEDKTISGLFLTLLKWLQSYLPLEDYTPSSVAKQAAFNCSFLVNIMILRGMKKAIYLYLNYYYSIDKTLKEIVLSYINPIKILLWWSVMKPHQCSFAGILSLYLAK